ncbi:TadE family protein [Vampirovibrio chlorellavorus]|uniref:TadE family protein n=1 Tax=Vampirovibrio chlorellavorus TaxID=758823 RepID=UPI0026EAA32E|nr:TadE family protein [Vampirovibrio chlorellavorus]
MKRFLGKQWPVNGKQSGQAIIEMIGGMIIFTLLLTMVMSLSVYLYFQQALVTAAREGARHASLNNNLGSASTERTGISEIQSYVTTAIRNLTGQTVSPSVATITVVPPSASASQSAGNRNVTVSIQWRMTNPLGVANFLDALGADGDNFRTFPVAASATMRYEE